MPGITYCTHPFDAAIASLGCAQVRTVRMCIYNGYTIINGRALIIKVAHLHQLKLWQQVSLVHMPPDETASQTNEEECNYALCLIRAVVMMSLHDVLVWTRYESGQISRTL